MIKRIKLDKFFITTIIIIIALIAYAIFFASPAFEALGSTANNVAVGLITATAIAYALTMSIMLLVKKSKNNSFKVTYKQPQINRSYNPEQVEASVIQKKVNAFAATTKMDRNMSENERGQNTQLTQPPKKPTSVKQEVNVEKKLLQVHQPMQQSTEPMTVKQEVAPTSRTVEKEQKNVEVAIERPPKLTPGKASKLTCPSCKKRFSTPLYSVDYSSNKPRLAGHCPYCNTVVVTLSDSTQQTINPVEVEEYFKRGSSSPKV